MRATLRLFANVKPRYMTAGAPTGLTGLYTHPAPRPTLIYLYNKTLEKLKDFPESSAYRQSVEATTRHRMNIVQSKIPPGYEAWKARVEEALVVEPGRFAELKQSSGPFGHVGLEKEANPEGFDHRFDEPHVELEQFQMPLSEGATRSPEEQGQLETLLNETANNDSYEKKMELESEPALQADQISEIEQEIGHGLIEEIVEVAEAELKLLDELRDAKVWEELEEKPAQGQWTYFERH